MRIQRRTPLIYVTLAAAQGAVVLWAPSKPLMWSYASILATIAFTAFLCARRARFAVRHNHPLWGMLMGCILAKGIAFVLLWQDSRIHLTGTLVTMDPTLWFCIASLFLVVATSYDPATPLQRWTSVVDLLLASLAVGLFYSVSRQTLAAAADPIRLLTLLFDALDVFVAVCSSIRLMGTRRSDERRFFVVLTAYAWVDAFAAGLHNRLAVSSSSLLPELLLCLPLIALGLLLSQRKKVWIRGYRPSASTRRLSECIRPSALCVAVCLTAALVGQTQTQLAIIAFSVALILFTSRSAFVVWYHLLVEQQLRMVGRQLHYAADHDVLTGLVNRRGLFNAVAREYTPSRHPEGFAIIMIDVDHFKAYNDRYGHLAGDQCLACVAATLKTLRGNLPHCTVARYGGEEFVIALPGADEATAHRFADLARCGVAALELLHEAAPKGIVTMSAGISAVRGNDWPMIDTLLRQADAAVYAAKRLRRDRVVLATDQLALNIDPDH